MKSIIFKVSVIITLTFLLCLHHYGHSLGSRGDVHMRKLPIFYNALLLTGVNLVLRLVSTSFQVFISSRIGAGGVGLVQLVMSVAAMSMTAGTAGIRTATMYLTAEELGKRLRQIPELPLRTVTAGAE